MRADLIDLPSLDFGSEVFAQHLQFADQAIADIDVGDFERSLVDRNPRHQLFGGLGADIFGPLFRQIPKLFGVFQADARNQVLQRQTITRHHRTEQTA